MQHRLLENKATLWAWLQEGASFYVCGDAHRMAKDVEATMLEICQQEGTMSEEGAREYLKTLRKEKRYLADVY